MFTNSYFERLNFDSGKQINISNDIDMSFSGKMHWHPYVEILLSLYDNNEVTINFTEYVLKKNDLIIIYPGDLHSVKNVAKDAFILVQFSVDLLLIMSEFNKTFPMFHKYHYIKYDPSNIECDRMMLLIKTLSEHYYSDKIFSEVRIYSLLLDFFVKLGHYCLNAYKEGLSGDVNTDYKTTKLMTEACLYISQNCAKPLTLTDISNYIGISTSHFSHLFKKYTNMTFIDYLTAERIKRTEFLMANPKVRIIDIAYDSGFSSLSSFNRSFKKIKGISPSEYRETMINTASQS